MRPTKLNPLTPSAEVIVGREHVPKKQEDAEIASGSTGNRNKRYTAVARYGLSLRKPNRSTVVGYRAETVEKALTETAGKP